MTDAIYTYPCPRCQVGHCQRSMKPYLRVYGDLLVNVPDMPIWTCDICGFYEYERDALARLENLMSSKAAPRTRHNKNQTNRTSRRVKP
jgi:hypothetical protein